MNAYHWVCDKLVLPVGDVLSGQSVMPYFRQFERLQWAPREAIGTARDANLRQTIRVAYEETAFYRRLYDAAGVHPDAIRTVADLPKLPVVTKEMLREAYPDGCTRPTEHRSREYFTSGSTGRPFVVRADAGTMSRARALMMLRATYAGWRPGDRVLQTGMTTNRGLVKGVKDRVLRTWYVSAFDLTDEALDNQLESIRRHRIRFVMGYAASLFLLAQRAQSTAGGLTLNGVVSWGDNMFPHYRKTIEESFGCRVTDTYGCGEGIQMAAQCEAGKYHQFEMHAAVELLREGAPVATGETGEVVVTRLDPGAMPLIRYSVGDLATADGDTSPCSCGRTLSALKSIEGRSTDVVLTASGNRLIVHFFTGILEFARSIETFQVVQHEVGKVLVRIVPRGAFDRDEWERLKREMIERAGGDLVVESELVDEIPLQASHKRRFVVSTVWSGARAR